MSQSKVQCSPYPISVHINESLLIHMAIYLKSDEMKAPTFSINRVGSDYAEVPKIIF